MDNNKMANIKLVVLSSKSALPFSKHLIAEPH